MFNRKSAVVSAILFAVLAVFGLRSGWETLAEGGREDTAHLDFVRTDTIQTFKDQQVLCENYVVREGDYIWKILRSRGHDSVGQLLHWSEVLKTVNQEVEDLNKIYPGQKLLVPLRMLKEIKAGGTGSAGELAVTSYEVKPGESISGILHHRFHLSDQLIFNKAINQILELNPNIKDPDLIQPGQRLVMPLFESVKGVETARPESRGGVAVAAAPPTTGQAQTEPVTEETAAGQMSAQEHAAGPTEVVIDAGRTRPTLTGAPVQEAGPNTILKTRLAPSVTPEEQRVQILADAVMAVVVAMGGHCQNSGRHFLPLKGEGQITLKAQSFPLLEIPSGERIFLDIEDRLPPALEEVIKTSWQGRYVVVNVNNSDNFRTVWQRVLDEFTGMQQWLDREPLLIHEPLEITIRGDWVLTVLNPQPQGRKVFVINLLNDGRERTDSALQAFLDGVGIRVVDVQLRGQLERARVAAPLDETAFTAHPAAALVRLKTAPEAVASFLDLLGQTYQRDANVLLYAGEQRNVTFSVKAAFYFKRRGESHLVDFRLLSAPVLSLLKERGFKVLEIDPGLGTNQVLQAMMAHLGLTADKSHPVFVSSRAPERNISLTLPGKLIREGEKEFLLTPTVLPASLTDFLDRHGVRILVYQSG